VSASPTKYSLFVIVSLVLLRLAIGWHFYKEGAKKFEPGFSAAPFLWQSKGPLAGTFQGMIADPFGVERLQYETTEAAWKRYVEHAAVHYRYNELQRKAAAVRLAQFLDQYAYALRDWGRDVDEYLIEVQWLQNAKKQDLANVSFRSDWIDQKTTELRGKSAPWLKQIDDMRKAFEDDLYAISITKIENKHFEKDGRRLILSPALERSLAETSVSRSGSRYKAPDPASMPWINQSVKWAVTLTGVFLVLGLFTRVFCIVGGGFLISVIASQFPFYPGAQPTYYQVIELCGLIVLFATAAGRYAGLDFFVYSAMHGLFRGTNQADDHVEGSGAKTG